MTDVVDAPLSHPQVSDDDFVQIVTGKLNSQQAFMKGRLKIKGNMGLAMKLEPIMKLARKKANL